MVIIIGIYQIYIVIDCFIFIFDFYYALLLYCIIILCALYSFLQSVNMFVKHIKNLFFENLF